MKYNRNTWWFMILISITILSCKGKSQTGAKSGWEKGTEISIYNGGGMVPESETVIIKDSSGIYIHWHMPATDSVKFRLSATELDNLMKEINRTRFREMKSGETEDVAYDKPTTSITWRNGDKSLTVSDGAGEKIQKGNEKDFFELYNYIKGIAKKQ
jgi:hypothetical protein